MSSGLSDGTSEGVPGPGPSMDSSRGWSPELGPLLQSLRDSSPGHPAGTGRSPGEKKIDVRRAVHS